MELLTLIWFCFIFGLTVVCPFVCFFDIKAAHRLRTGYVSSYLLFALAILVAFCAAGMVAYQFYITFIT